MWFTNVLLFLNFACWRTLLLTEREKNPIVVCYLNLLFNYIFSMYYHISEVKDFYTNSVAIMMVLRKLFICLCSVWSTAVVGNKRLMFIERGKTIWAAEGSLNTRDSGAKTTAKLPSLPSILGRVYPCMFNWIGITNTVRKNFMYWLAVLYILSIFFVNATRGKMYSW